MSPVERREVRKAFYQRFRNGDFPTLEELGSMPRASFEILTQVTNHFERLSGKPEVIFSRKSRGDK